MMLVYTETDPRDNLGGRAVDPLHRLDLVILLFAISLINPHSIDPDPMLVSLSA
jgi:hypothetical protein